MIGDADDAALGIPPGGALVLFSGGQDSTTCLADALRRHRRVETVGFDYGQRHAVELSVRAPIRAALDARFPGRLGPDHIVPLGATIAALGETALTADLPIETGPGGLPTSFVPGRNLLFFTAAAAIAWRRDLRVLVGGMCETDFSGYPDCRDDTLKALQVALTLGLDRRVTVETPLMFMSKAATWEAADRLGITDIIIGLSHSCYLGDHTTRHAWGYGCGACPACELRRTGYKRWSEFPASIKCEP